MWGWLKVLVSRALIFVHSFFGVGPSVCLTVGVVSCVLAAIAHGFSCPPFCYLVRCFLYSHHCSRGQRKHFDG